MHEYLVVGKKMNEGDENTLRVHGKALNFVYDEEAFRVEAGVEELEEGLAIIDVKMTAVNGPALPKIDVEWSIDLIDIQCQWHPMSRDNKHLMPSWNIPYPVNVTYNAPVLSLYNLDGINRMTFAMSEIMIPTEMYCNMSESAHSCLNLAARLRPEQTEKVEEVHFTVRVDVRHKHFARSLEDVVAWWEVDYPPRKINPLSREPLYSSWYAFHADDLNSDEFLQEAKLAGELGCKLAVIDAGWCSNEGTEGEYALGDWQLYGIKDMDRVAKEIHDSGMGLMLWFAAPFVGDDSVIWKEFKEMVFPGDSAWKIFDFRYPVVREYVQNIMQDYVDKYNLEGLKIDFIDFIPFDGRDKHPGDPARDTQSVAWGVKHFLDGALEKLSAVREEPLIEFRQSYLGPLMRQYATMIRAVDCAQDSVANRLLIADVRLLNKGGVTHSDMFIWNVNDPVEVAALQFANIIFSVPQVSVRVSMLPEDHKKMLAYYLKFWVENRDLLLDGEFTPLSPECNYPALFSENENAFIAGVYSPVLVHLPEKDKLIIVNGTTQTTLAADLPKGTYQVQVTDCMGNIVEEGTVDTDGLTGLNIPRCGIWTAVKC